MSALNKILAVSIGGLGDTILFSPLLKALRKSYPGAHIELLVANRLAQEAYSFAKEVSCVTFINFNRSSPLLKTASLLPFIFAACLDGKFDIGIFATGLNPKLGQLMKTVGIVRDITFAPNVYDCPEDLDCNVKLARVFDSDISSNDVFIPITEESENEAENALKNHGISLENDRLIAIYPSTSFWHRPRWELSKLLKVIHAIKSKVLNVNFVVVGSAADGIDWGKIDKNKIVDANLAGTMSILGTASLLKRCHLSICNDGGIMHVAGAVKCPVVAIMPNAPANYHPPGEKTETIHPNISCSVSCYPDRPRTCKIAKCVNEISSERVARACLQSLTKFG